MTLKKLSEKNTSIRDVQLVALNLLKIVDKICRNNNIEYFLDGGTLLGAVRYGKFIPWDDDIDIGMTRENYEKFITISKKELPKDLFLQNLQTTDKAKNTWTQIKDRNSKLEIFGGDMQHPGIYLDIFPYDYYSENRIKRFKELFLKKLYIKVYAINSPFKKPLLYKKNLKKNLLKLIVKIIAFPFAIYNNKLIYKKNLKTRFKRINNLKNNPNKILGYGTDILNFDNIWNKDIIYPLKEIKFEDSLFFAPKNTDKYLSILYGANYMTPPPEDERHRHSLNIKIGLTPEEFYNINRDFQYDKNSNR